MSEERSVDEIMTTDVITLREEDNLRDLEQGVDLSSHRAFPVVDGDKLVGLITHRELLRATRFAPQGATMSAAAEQEFVAALMNRNPNTVSPGTPVREVARRLLGHNSPCVLVVDDERRLKGIVTKDDILALLIQQGA
jgi:CBS domain-containing protein